MDAKQVVARAYELFGNGEMEAWTETIDDNVVFTLPGDKHPFSEFIKVNKQCWSFLQKFQELGITFMLNQNL